MKFTTIAMAAALFVAPALMNAQTNHTINQRKIIQQHRIAQGVRSGQLRPRQTARLERNERGINRQERFMRRTNGGRLTQRDRRVINRRQNRVSRRIYRARHNGRAA